MHIAGGFKVTSMHVKGRRLARTHTEKAYLIVGMPVVKMPDFVNWLL